MAYLRMTRSQFDPTRYEELLRLIPDLARAMQQLPGCQHVHVGLDRAVRKGLAVSIFDTLEHAQFSREGLGEVIPRSQALGLRLEAPEFYELVP